MVVVSSSSNSSSSSIIISSSDSSSKINSVTATLYTPWHQHTYVSHNTTSESGLHINHRLHDKVLVINWICLTQHGYIIYHRLMFYTQSSAVAKGHHISGKLEGPNWHVGPSLRRTIATSDNCYVGPSLRRTIATSDLCYVDRVMSPVSSLRSSPLSWCYNRHLATMRSAAFRFRGT